MNETSNNQAVADFQSLLLKQLDRIEETQREELKGIKETQREQSEKLYKIHGDVAGLKVRAALTGALSGAMTAVVAILAKMTINNS